MILNKRREPWRKYCASLFSKGLAPFPSNPEVLPPNNVIVNDLPYKAHTQVGGSSLDTQREFDIVSVVNVVRTNNDISRNTGMLAAETAKVQTLDVKGGGLRIKNLPSLTVRK